jgi:hypothetical protein
MAEVSNLIDLKGRQQLLARRVLADTIAVFSEPHVSSLQASGGWNYYDLGLADSAISVVARERQCEGAHGRSRSLPFTAERRAAGGEIFTSSRAQLAALIRSFLRGLPNVLAHGGAEHVDMKLVACRREIVSVPSLTVGARCQ